MDAILAIVRCLDMGLPWVQYNSHSFDKGQTVDVVRPLEMPRLWEW